MITLNMHRVDVVKHIRKEENLLPFFGRKTEEWKKISKKMLPKQIGGKIWPWHSKQTNQDYYILFCKNAIYDKACNLILKVRGEKGEYYFVPNISDPDVMSLFSTHFWKRYAERMHYLYAMPSLITKFFSRNHNQSVIYYNEKERRAVYMTNDGIILCELDDKRGLYIMRTFVSNEMLKDTQKDAYKVLEGIKKELDEFWAKAYKHDVLDIASEIIQDFVRPFSEHASDIYAQYWEED